MAAAGPAVTTTDGGASAWDARYAAGATWGTEPNVWVRRHAGDLPPGRALDLAAGDGRHAAWLASLGWDVLAVDISPEAVRRGAARTVANGTGGRVTWRVGDARDRVADARTADLVVVAYLHLPPDELARALTHAAAVLAPGGRAVVVGHDARNLAEGTGGPQDPAVLTSPGPVSRALEAGGLVVDVAEVARRPVPGASRDALDTVVVARRPGPSTRPE